MAFVSFEETLLPARLVASLSLVLCFQGNTKLIVCDYLEFLHTHLPRTDKSNLVMGGTLECSRSGLVERIQLQKIPFVSLLASSQSFDFAPSFDLSRSSYVSTYYESRTRPT